MNWHDDIVSGRTLMIGFQLDSNKHPIEPDLQYRVKRMQDGTLIILRCYVHPLDQFNIELKNTNRLN